MAQEHGAQLMAQPRPELGLCGLRHCHIDLVRMQVVEA